MCGGVFQAAGFILSSLATSIPMMFVMLGLITGKRMRRCLPGCASSVWCFYFYILSGKLNLIMKKNVPERPADESKVS